MRTRSRPRSRNWDGWVRDGRVRQEETKGGKGKPMHQVRLITDGSCVGNPGPGGGACIPRCGQHERMLSGGEKTTTNNRMELVAVIEDSGL